jgi:hypothetical protein
MTISLDDPIPLHLLLLSSYDALREYANAKSIFIEFELADYIKGEFQREWIKEYFKKKFYFLNTELRISILSISIISRS